MDATTTKQEIAEIRSMQRQAALWRTGASLLSILWVGACLLSLNDAARGLINKGPRQDEFVKTLSTNVQANIAPQAQDLAKQTLTESRPLIEAEFKKMSGRVPELAQASLNELKSLQTTLPEKGQKAIDATYGKMITEKEAKLRTEFPDATEDQVKGLATNLTKLAQERAVSVNNNLFGRHQALLTNIVGSMNTIKAQEPKTASNNDMQTSWDMAIAVLGVVQDEAVNGKTPVKAAPMTNPAQSQDKVN